MVGTYTLTLWTDLDTFASVSGASLIYELGEFLEALVSK